MTSHLNGDRSEHNVTIDVENSRRVHNSQNSTEVGFKMNYCCYTPHCAALIQKERGKILWRNFNE